VKLADSIFKLGTENAFVVLTKLKALEKIKKLLLNKVFFSTSKICIYQTK
jgi:hypothetical protein